MGSGSTDEASRKTHTQPVNTSREPWALEPGDMGSNLGSTVPKLCDRLSFLNSLCLTFLFVQIEKIIMGTCFTG